MPTLWRIPEKYKAILILVALVVSCCNTMMQAFVKIFDDSDLTIEEAVGFGTSTLPDVVGKWREKTPEDD